MFPSIRQLCCCFKCNRIISAFRNKTIFTRDTLSKLLKYVSAVIKVLQRVYMLVIYILLFFICGIYYANELRHTSFIGPRLYYGNSQIIHRGSGKLDQSCCYITHMIRGRRRLGNTLFVYASFLGTVTQNNYTPVLHHDTTLSKFFDTRILSSLVNESLFNTIDFKYRGEPGAIKFDHDLVHKRPTENLSLEGFFQSYYYFDHIRDTIRREFQFKEMYQSKAKTFLKRETGRMNLTLWHNVLKIGIHARRGDMLNNGNRKFGFLTADEHYFRKAMDVMRERYAKDWILLWVIVSVDIPWCRRNIKPLPGEFAVFSNYDPATDMAVLTYCDHVILSTGSFGWWAGFLAGGDVIYMKNWIRNGTELDRISDMRTYFYPHWTAIT